MHCDNDAYDDGVVSACRSRWSHMREITQLSAEFSGPRKSDDDVMLTEFFFLLNAIYVTKKQNWYHVCGPHTLNEYT